MQKSEAGHEVYLFGGVFLGILPINNIILALGGIIIILAGLLLVIKAYKNKKADEKYHERISGIKTRFNDIKDESSNQEDDEWLETRLKEDSSKYQRQLGMNKK